MQIRSGRSVSGRRAITTALLAATTLAGCEGIMEVELPGNLTEEGLLQPASAVTLVNSAIADFECAYSMYSTMSGAVEDTWWRATGYWGGWAEYQTDRPATGECADGDTSSSFITSFMKSRLMSETAYNKISEWGADVANSQRLLATAATYAGLNYQIFGETFCEVTIDVGPIMKPNQVLAKSEEWFTKALSHMAATDYSVVSTNSLKQLALLGRARVRLAQGNLAGAAADAALIQPGFIAYATRDASVRSRWNHVYRTLNVQGYSAVAGQVRWQGAPVAFTGYRNLTIDAQGRSTVNGFPVTVTGVRDPRVPAQFMNEFLQDGVTDNFAQQKYLSLDADIPIARYAEAQLILAEVKGGAAAVPHINAIRAVHNLPAYAGPTDATSIRNTIIEERRREFFLEGRFFAEKLRQNLWFPRNAGINHKNVPYGNATCWMMPVSEYQNNPNVPEGYEGPY